MRKYKCHKIVEADQIIQISQSENKVWLKGDSMDTSTGVPQDFFARGVPNIGDYFVVYENNYVSWSPKKVFEDGYTQIQEEVA